MSPIALILIDANDVSRHGVEAMLRQQAVDLQIAGTFANCADAERFLPTHPVNVILIEDSTLSAEVLAHFVSRVQTQHPKAKIMVLSHHLSVPYIEHLIDRGIAGFVYFEDRLAHKILRGIETVMEGELYLSPRASALSYVNKPSAELQRLTKRDLDVLLHMKDGMTVQESAAVLQVNDAAIYRSRRKLRSVLHVRTSDQIVTAALRRGILPE